VETSAKPVAAVLLKVDILMFEGWKCDVGGKIDLSLIDCFESRRVGNCD
jgi:hypothetical protein